MSHYEPLRPAERFAILERDGFCCVYCGARAPEARLQVDHRKSRADGGTNDRWNLLTACQLCNAGKASRSLSARWDQCAELAAAALVVEATLERFKSDVTPGELYLLFCWAREFHESVDTLGVVRSFRIFDALAEYAREDFAGGIH